MELKVPLQMWQVGEGVEVQGEAGMGAILAKDFEGLATDLEQETFGNLYGKLPDFSVEVVLV